jgi:hypothetical protein
LSPEQSGKVKYERERLLGIANKFIHLFAIPSSIRLFRFARGTTLIEIAVYLIEHGFRLELFDSFVNYTLGCLAGRMNAHEIYY